MPLPPCYLLSNLSFFLPSPSLLFSPSHAVPNSHQHPRTLRLYFFFTLPFFPPFSTFRPLPLSPSPSLSQYQKNTHLLQTFLSLQFSSGRGERESLCNRLLRLFVGYFSSLVLCGGCCSSSSAFLLPLPFSKLCSMRSNSALYFATFPLSFHSLPSLSSSLLPFFTRSPPRSLSSFFSRFLSPSSSRSLCPLSSRSFVCLCGVWKVGTLSNFSCMDICV